MPVFERIKLDEVMKAKRSRAMLADGGGVDAR